MIAHAWGYNIRTRYSWSAVETVEAMADLAIKIPENTVVESLKLDGVELLECAQMFATGGMLTFT